MNAPLLRRDATARNATLHLFALFHLNLAFSSIEEAQRGEVIRRCYWPLLRLAHEHGPIGLEATGFTLEEVAARDPEWCAEAARLIKNGQIEFIGSGYSQVIGPLVPAKVTEANLRIGNDIYRRLLGIEPSLALVNEQAYSAGLVGLYCDAGYRAILMDWDNPAAHHPEWSPETRYLPQRALGAADLDIALLWTSTVAFQKLQRLAHGDIALDDYVEYVAAQRTGTPRALCLYASDAEIFDFRPGRYRTEESLAGEDEWVRIGDALAALKAKSGLRLIAPSEALAIDDFALRPALRLESVACPVPVKKQRKYNLSRWAVTGRDDLGINAACERIYAALRRAKIADTGAWKELCYLWSSDFRTHITDERWKEYCARLAQAEAWWVAHDETENGALSPPSLATCFASDEGHPPRERVRKVKQTRILLSSPVYGGGVAHILRDGGGCSTAASVRPGMTTKSLASASSLPRHITIDTPAVKASLDRRRGLAITSLQFAGNSEPIVGGLPHGHFDDIALQADWYTGDCVFEAPGEHKITDLEWCDAVVTTEWNGDVVARADIATPKGPIRKTLRFCATRQTVEFDLLFDWENWDRGVLRLGHFTLLPQAFDWDALSLTTHNGGKEFETFLLRNEAVDHGAPVSFLVSSSFGIGMTEGWVELGDTQRRIRIDIDRETAPLLGLLSHRRIGGSLFCQLALSALELDETRKPSPYRTGPRQFRFSISRAAPSVHC